jgi:hypothetical protein
MIDQRYEGILLLRIRRMSSSSDGDGVGGGGDKRFELASVKARVVYEQ